MLSLKKMCLLILAPVYLCQGNHENKQNLLESTDAYDVAKDLDAFIKKLRITGPVVIKNKTKSRTTIEFQLSDSAESDSLGELIRITLRAGENYYFEQEGNTRLLSVKLIDSNDFINPRWGADSELMLYLELVQDKHFLHRSYPFDFSSRSYSAKDLLEDELGAETVESRRGFNGHLMWVDGVIAAHEGLTLTEIDSRRRALYEENNVARILKQDPRAFDRSGSRIPLIMHKIWMTADDRPVAPHDHYLDYFEKSIEHNPPSAGWKHYLWVENRSKLPELVERLEEQSAIKVMEISELPLPLISGNLYKEALKNRQFGKASDILRGEILIQQGGYYLDTDYELFQSLKPYSKIYDMVVGLEPMSVFLGNAFIGAKPNHPVIHQYLKLITRNLNKETTPEYLDSDSGFSTIVATGPAVMTIAFALAAGKDGNRDIALPPMLLYPTLFNRYPEQYVVTPDSPIPAVSIGAHYWETAWMREEFGSKG